MAKKRASTTPKSDLEAGLFASWYEKHEKIDCTCDQFNRRKCKCGCKIFVGISAYAMHRSSAEVFCFTECGRHIWFNRTDYGILKEESEYPL